MDIDDYSRVSLMQLTESLLTKRKDHPSEEDLTVLGLVLLEGENMDAILEIESVELLEATEVGTRSSRVFLRNPTADTKRPSLLVICPSPVSGMT